MLTTLPMSERFDSGSSMVIWTVFDTITWWSLCLGGHKMPLRVMLRQHCIEESETLKVTLITMTLKKVKLKDIWSMLHQMDTIKQNKLYFIIAEKEIVLDFFAFRNKIDCFCISWLCRSKKHPLDIFQVEIRLASIDFHWTVLGMLLIVFYIRDWLVRICSYAYTVERDGSFRCVVNIRYTVSNVDSSGTVLNEHYDTQWMWRHNKML